MKSPAKFIREVKQEGAKVTWPTKKEVWVASLLVVIAVIIMSLFFFLVDWAVSGAVRQILGL